jgi:uncharacterized protein (TIGR02246 family)
MWIRLLLVGCAVWMAGACAARPQNEFGRDDAEAVRKALQEFAAAYNKKDVQGLLALFSTTATLLPPNSSALRGHESIKGFYDIRLFEQGATDLEFQINDVAGHGPLAYVASTYTVRLAPKEGPEGRDRGKTLWILRNLANRWRVEYVMWSSDLPSGAPPAAKP